MAIFKNFVAKSQKCFCKWTFTLIKNFFWWKLSFFENCQHNKWWLFFATFSLKCGYFWYFGGGAKSGYFWEFCGWKAWKCFGNTENKNKMKDFQIEIQWHTDRKIKKTWEKCFSIRLQRNGQKSLFSEKVLKNSEQSVTEILALSIQVHI